MKKWLRRVFSIDSHRLTDPIGDLEIAEEKQRAFRLAEEMVAQAERTKKQAEELLEELKRNGR